MEEKKTKRYSLRPGIVLAEICGEYLLVATGEARSACPYVTQINPAAAEHWKLCERYHCDMQAVAQALARRPGADKRRILPNLFVFVKKMQASGYLLEEDA